jgi:hypothetical protein
MDNIDNFGLALTNRNATSNIELSKIDCVEIIDSGIFDAVPYLGAIVSTFKGVMNLRDKISFKKFIRFLQNFENKLIDEDKLKQFQEKIKSDKTYRIKITETLIEYIDDIKGENKIEIYSNLFAAYINENYDWKYFLQLSECLTRVNLDNLNLIPKINTTEGKEVKQYDELEVSAESDLISAGLAIEMSVWSSDIYPTRFGLDLVKYGLQNNKFD